MYVSHSPNAASDKTHDAMMAAVATCAAYLPARPIRGPNSTISANEASGSSQARANNSGNRISKFMDRVSGQWSVVSGQWLERLIPIVLPHVSGH